MCVALAGNGSSQTNPGLRWRRRQVSRTHHFKALLSSEARAVQPGDLRQSARSCRSMQLRLLLLCLPEMLASTGNLHMVQSSK